MQRVQPHRAHRAIRGDQKRAQRAERQRGALVDEGLTLHRVHILFAYDLRFTCGD
jgi:hypothetical protein